MTKVPHIHAEVIKAWADGEIIQGRNPCATLHWEDIPNPQWHTHCEYRVKPRIFPKSTLSYQDLCNFNVDASRIKTAEGFITVYGRLVADAAVKQYILDMEKNT